MNEPTTATTTTTIVVADDHAVVRSGLRLLLDAEAGLRGRRRGGRHARRDAHGPRRTGPTVLVLDLNMPGGLEPGRDPRPRAPRRPRRAIVVLTMQDDPAFARRALQNGALGFVLKEAADEELLEAVRAAARGRYLPQPAAGRAAGRGAAAAARPARRPHGPRGRGPAPDRAGTHQRRDRASSSSSPCAPSRRTGRTSSRSCAARAAPSSCDTRSRTSSSRSDQRKGDPCPLASPSTASAASAAPSCGSPSSARPTSRSSRSTTSRTPPTLAHLLARDSVYGRFPAAVARATACSTSPAARSASLSGRDPADLPWADLGVDVVIEATGRFRTRADAQRTSMRARAR